MKWEPVIGLEVHVQLATASKAFSASAASFGERPNSLTDPVVLGLPGCLPVFNARALEMAVRLGLACGCAIRPRSRFARKHYFYPDLPKGYQISQYDEPLCDGGAIDLGTRSVKLTRIHLEEDAGKSTHQPGGAISHVDLNRAGVPLVEVVSQPDIFSAAEAADYMRALRGLCRWLGLSEGVMVKGQLRCDANVSLRPVGAATLGTRAELKNINSFRFVEDAIEHEIARQARILDGGGQVVQETRLWDSDARQSHSMRSKEEAMDYRYFPDPDLPPLEITAAEVDALRAALPPLPGALRARFAAVRGLTDEDVSFLTADRERAIYFTQVEAEGDAKPIANWLLGEPELHARVEVERLRALAALVRDGAVSAAGARKVVTEMMQSAEPPAAIVERLGLAQVSDASAIEALAAEVIAASPQQVAAYRGGKAQLIGYFVGQVMKRSGGSANPQLVQEVLRRLLDGPA